MNYGQDSNVTTSGESFPLGQLGQAPTPIIENKNETKQKQEKQRTVL